MSSTPLMNWWKNRLFVKSNTPKSVEFSAKSSVVNSPVTDLALNIEDLTTACVDARPPKRKLLLDVKEVKSGISRQESVDEGFSFELPINPVDIVNFSQDSSCQVRNTGTYLKKFKSLPLSSYGFLPISTPKTKLPSGVLIDTASQLKDAEAVLPCDREDESSQDSGLGLDKDDFKVPRLPLSQLSKAMVSNFTPQHTEPRCQTKMSFFRSFSTPALSTCSPAIKNADKNATIKVGLVRDENADDADDGFVDMLDSEDRSVGTRPLNFAKEIAVSNEPLQNLAKILLPQSKKRLRSVSTDPEAQPDSKKPSTSTRRNLFSLSKLKLDRSKSFNVGSTSPSDCQENSGLKHCRGSDTDSPLTPVSEALSIAPVRRLVRCQSEAMIKSALMKSDGQYGDLIGDFSQSYCLPLVPSRHQDLKAISPATMAAILNNGFCDSLAKYFVVDCRYPYEFCAGHLHGALNIYSKETIVQEFFSSAAIQNADATIMRRPVVIFHCEFSSERGPKLMRFLRNTDRESNKECYPALHYPELYLLEGGYKAFFQLYPELCDPQGYKPMLHEDHTSEMKHFRSLSRSRNLAAGTSLQRSLWFDA